MFREACVLVVVVSLSISPSFAQGAVGGPPKGQSYVGGPTAQKNPVVPPRRGETAKTGQSVSKVLKK